MMVQVWAFVFMLGTSIVSIYRDYSMGHVNIATFWCLLNTFFLGAFVVTAFLENRQRKQERNRSDDTRPKRGVAASDPLDSNKQLTSETKHPEALDAEAILDAQAAKGVLAENPELHNRKG